MAGAGWAMHGIPGDITLGLILAALAVFYALMICAGIVIAVTEPPAPQVPAPDAEEAPCRAS